jgi:hypothetical protein
LPGWQTYFRTPADCVRHLRETFSESAPDELLISADRPGIPLEDALESLRMFAEKVLPQLQNLPLAK